MRRHFGVGSLVLISVLVAPAALGAVEERPVRGRLTDDQGMTLGSLYDGAGGTAVASASRLTGGLDISF
jgi:hypothetical protein